MLNVVTSRRRLDLQNEDDQNEEAAEHAEGDRHQSSTPRRSSTSHSPYVTAMATADAASKYQIDAGTTAIKTWFRESGMSAGATRRLQKPA
ncbi:MULTISPECIES: hypothetical protein [Streptomyces]|uniref:hypothetical protein n=1 Tax=Streptomyces TaxID=1883 RepID=UPI000F7A17CA|nr:hypothetical protein [Streptomyces sp. WAC05858]RSS45095.1 hypothetical protein EF902_14890 [Streptomyces sp. WAC05858]WTA80589.1 hypothetical protein OG751_12080 [Streptomyces antimycoticus]